MTNDIVARLRQSHRVGCECFGCEAADEIERLRGERDAARAEVCLLRPSVCLGAQSAEQYAESRGWDCFKENDDDR